MPFTPDLLEELNLLARFDLATAQQGIKVHTTTATAATIAAAQRLHVKGMITLPDGGYLTALGRETAEHIQGTLTLLAV